MKIWLPVLFSLAFAAHPFIRPGLQVAEAELQLYASEMAKTTYLFTFILTSLALSISFTDRFEVCKYFIMALFPLILYLFERINGILIHRGFFKLYIDKKSHLEVLSRLEKQIIIRSVGIGLLQTLLSPVMIIVAIAMLICKQQVTWDSIMGEDRKVKYLLSDRFIPRVD